MKIVFTLIFAGFFIFISPAHNLAAKAETVSLRLEDYLELQKGKEAQYGGHLMCGETLMSYNTCDEFRKLQHQDCYGRDTVSMKKELFYEDLCHQIDLLETGEAYQNNFFDLEFENWWAELPAELIPMKGGVQSEDQFDVLQKELIVLHDKKWLKHISFERIHSSPLAIEAVLASEPCDGTRIEDTLTITPKVLADFDGDGKADMLVSINRVDRLKSSDAGCWLGTGNSLGGTSFRVLKKTTASGPVYLMDLNIN